MDPETALELVKRGATLLLLDVPQFTLIGIDTQMFSSGPNFKGIKMIPPGVRFVYYSSSNREGNAFSPIIGFFVDAQPSQVIVRTWNKIEERFIKLSDEEEERYAVAVKRLEFDGQLGPYALDAYGDWNRLSSYISKDTIDRIEPIGGEVTVASESDMFGNMPKSAVEKALDEQLKASKFSKQGENSRQKDCFYTPIPRVIKHKVIRGQELTNLNLDKTQLLESLLMNEYGGDEDLLLAEFQFAFIAFLMGQSLEAFSQWKSLVSLLFGCSEAPLHTRSRLFIKFIKVLYHQLKFGFQRDQEHNPVATENGVLPLLDESWLSADSFLHHLCKDFFSLVLEAPVVDGDLLSWTRKLKQLLEDSLGWDFQNSAVDGVFFEDDDEFAPVVEMVDEPISYHALATET